MDTIAQVIHECETCAAIKQAKRVKPQWYGGRWQNINTGRLGRLTASHCHKPAKASAMCSQWRRPPLNGWKPTLCPMPPPGIPSWALKASPVVTWHPRKKTELDNGTHFCNSLIDTWAKEHSIEWVYHIPYHAPAAGKIEWYIGLLKTTLRAMGGWDFKKLGCSFSKGHLVG